MDSPETCYWHSHRSEMAASNQLDREGEQASSLWLCPAFGWFE